MSSAERAFLNRLLEAKTQVLNYEDPSLRAKARACVPFEKLVMQAKSKSPDKSDNKLFRDVFLVELLEWFKQDFFKWFNAPPCNFCKQPMTFSGHGTPNSEDLMYGATRIENFSCQSCGTTDRFPRYNDPGKLLETRKGRCGEWANCFTLICRAFEYDTRYVLDWTDHVWTEVYSDRLNRWLHCDSCEAACDKPLLYDAGWGKKLNYVLAFSKDEVQDVTWRYTRDYKDVLKRRELVSEEWLLAQTTRLTAELQSSVNPSRKQFLTSRLMRELIEFLTPPKVKDGEEQGRTSGDFNWRQMRGELGAVKSDSTVWTPTETEISNGEFTLEYSASLDEYIRRSNGGTVTKGWANGVFQHEDVFLKVEHDWNQAYLTRKEGSNKGTISWKFDLSSTSLSILQVSVSCPGTTYENGRVQWKLCGPDSCQIIPNGVVDHEVELTGAKWCELSAELTLGRGSVDWQHAQIARQSTKDNSYPLAFRVMFGSLD